MTNVRNKNSEIHVGHRNEINVGHRNVFVGFLCSFSYAQLHTSVSESDMMGGYRYSHSHFSSSCDVNGDDADGT